MCDRWVASWCRSRLLVVFRVFSSIYIRLRFVDEHIIADDLWYRWRDDVAHFPLTLSSWLEPGVGCVVESGSPDHHGAQDGRHASIHYMGPFGEH